MYRAAKHRELQRSLCWTSVFPLLENSAAIFLEINALVILTMIVCLIAHGATAIWDVSYAYRSREVAPTDQHVHSFLEMPPL